MIHVYTYGMIAPLSFFLYVEAVRIRRFYQNQRSTYYYYRDKKEQHRKRHKHLLVKSTCGVSLGALIYARFSCMFYKCLSNVNALAYVYTVRVLINIMLTTFYSYRMLTFVSTFVCIFEGKTYASPVVIFRIDE